MQNWLNKLNSIRKSCAQRINRVVCPGSCYRLFLLFAFLHFNADVFSATKTWSGATSTVWTLASNWVGNSTPGNGDNVLIPGGLTNYPVVNVNISFKNLTINSIGTGAKVTITAGVFNTADVLVAATGSLIISGGTMEASEIDVDGIFTMTGGNITNSGTLLINNGGVGSLSAGLIYMNSNSTSNPKDDLQILTGGVFNQTGGTISFKDFLPGGGVFNQTGTSSLITVARNWQMGTGSNFNSTSGTVQFTGNGPASNFAGGTRQFTNVIVNAGINPGFSFTPGSTIPIGGNFTNNNTTLVNTTNATFIFNGSVNQTASSATSGTGAIFGNLQVIKTAAVLSFLTNCFIAGDLTISSGSLDLVTFLANRTVAGGTLTMSAGATLLLRATTGGQPGSNFPLNFSTISLATASTVVYNGANQTVASVTYGNLTMSSSAGSVTKTLPATTLNVLGNLTSLIGSGTGVIYAAAGIINVGGNFIIGASTTFTGNNYSHTLGGNFLNSGTYSSAGNKIIFNGAGTQIITSPGAFNKLVINKLTGIVSITNDLIISDSLTFLKGVIRTGTFKIIKNTGQVTGAGQATGWVYGKLQKPVSAGTNVSVIYEIGDSLVYSPLSMVLGTVSASGNLVVSTTGTDHPLISGSLISPNRSVNRYWSCINAGINFSNGTFTFNWAASDKDTYAFPASFKVGTYAGTWDTVTAVNPGLLSIQAIGINAFKEFIVGEVCSSILAGRWTGNINTDWNEPENWRCGILPGSTTPVIIPSGLSQYPILNSGTGSASQITIETGASLTVSAAVLQLAGSIVNNGIFNVSNGGLEFNGTSLQVIPASVFSGNAISNLTINNSSGVNLAGILNLTEILKVTQGNFNANGYLTLAASATQTALIDGSGNGSVSGVVTMQRYLPSGFGYKYISSPFQSATVNELSDEINMTASFPPFYRYDENVVSSGWLNYTDVANALIPFTGYAANFGTAGTPVTMDIAGIVNNGTKSITLFNHNQPFTLGFNLVGNPYPSPVNWDYVSGWNRSNIDNAIYFLDASSSDSYGGTYSSYINGFSSNGVAGSIIPSMQGFFVHVSNGGYPVTGLLEINNSARTTDLQPVFHRTSQTETRPVIRLNAGFSNNHTDACVIYFDEDATEGFDREQDALKLMNTDIAIPSVYSIASDFSRLSINAMPEANWKEIEIPVGIRIDKPGDLEFVVSEMERIPDSIHVYLKDTYLRINHALQPQSSCKVFLEKGVYENRFHLILTTRDLPHITDNDQFGVYANGETIFMYVELPEGQQAKISVSNLQGQCVYESVYSASGQYQLNNNFCQGIYIVNFRSDETTFSKKLFLRHE